MSWHFSQALVAAYSADTCSAGAPSAPSSGSPTHALYCAPDRMKAFFRLSRFGMTCEPLTDDLGADLLTWFRAGSLVRTSAKPIPMQAGLMAREAAFGVKWGESSARYDPATHLLKTRQCLLFEDSTEFWQTLPEWGLMRDGECFVATLPEFLNAVPVCLLSQATGVPDKYQIKTPSMLRAIDRGWMQLADTLPTLTTKIRERAPCPYWQTPTGPRYLTEGEAEVLMGWPIGWSGRKPLGMDKFRQWRHSHGGF